MPAQPEFRAFAAADFPEIEAMALALYDEDPNVERMTAAKLRATCETLARTPAKGGIVTFQLVDSIVGYAIVIDFWSNEYGGDIATIDELYVLPAFRGLGIGTAFVEWLAASRAGSARGIALEVTPDNDRALEFYKRQGFAHDRTRHLTRRL